MTRKTIESEYFRWLCNLVCENRYSKEFSNEKLLARLHNTEFIYLIPRDRNRADDGIAMRWKFAITYGYEDNYDQLRDILNGPCSILEMMVALSLRCEEFMDDPDVGNRTKQWFWGMIVSLGLGSMSDARYDERTVDINIDRFLNRNYEPNGKGGLFTLRHCDYDLRDVEIWCQMCWYMDSIV